MVQFRVFERYNLNATDERITYDQLARELGVSPAAITKPHSARNRGTGSLCTDVARPLVAAADSSRRLSGKRLEAHGRRRHECRRGSHEWPRHPRHRK